MIANMYYREGYEGEDYPKYPFRDIYVCALDENSAPLQRYDVDPEEYQRQENGIVSHKSEVAESDFKLRYEFNLLSLLDDGYDGNLYFQVHYTQIFYDFDEEIDSPFSRTFRFVAKRSGDLINLEDFTQI